MIWLAIGAGVLVVLGTTAYLAWYFRWEAEQTSGMAYYGRPLSERRLLKQRIQRYSRPIKPLVRLLASMNRHRTAMPGFVYQGVSGPTRVSSEAIFERASRYQPRAEDVFVVTQMRCGTTWMQQLIYQIVTRGHGEFDDPRRSHLYAISPWIDAVNSVSIDKAPLVGHRPTRIIKSHLPASLCPYSPDAKYVYVTRHPVSCFASIVDYNRSLLGPLAPPIASLADWFCSDRMYWLPWPRHVDGWWQLAEQRDNVLFVHFEEMKQDFASVRLRVEQFLGCELTAEERQRVDARCSFAYMKDHEEFFEMAPPTMFSAEGGEFLPSGRESGTDDVTPAIRGQIVEYCRRMLAGKAYPAAHFYTDLAGRA
jgi:hypothetical protein